MNTPDAAQIALHYETTTVRSQSVINQIIAYLDDNKIKLPQELDSRARRETDSLLVHEKEVNYRNLNILHADLTAMMEMKELGIGIDPKQLSSQIAEQRQAIDTLQNLTNEDLLAAAYRTHA